MSSTQPEPELTPEDPNLDPRLSAYLFDLLEIGAKVAQSIGRQADLQSPARQADLQSPTRQADLQSPTRQADLQSPTRQADLQSPTQQADRQAQPTPAHPPIDVAEQFERVARAMRRTVLLIRHLATPGTKPAPQRTQARKRIIREVEDAIQRKAKEAQEAEPLHAEFRERLDSPDLDEEIANRPIADIITDIRRDLGIAHMPGTHPWQRRSPRDIEAMRRRAAAPRPPGPYDPAPHGPDPGAPKSNRPPRDPGREHRELVQLAKMLSGSA